MEGASTHLPTRAFVVLSVVGALGAVTLPREVEAEATPGSPTEPPAQIQEVWVAAPERPLATYPGGTTVELWAGEAAEPQAVSLTVVGPGLVLASAMEIRHEGGGILGGSALTISRRIPQGPLGPERVKAEVTLNRALTPGGRYEVWVRFPVENDGPLKFQLRIYEQGEITEIRHTGGALRYGLPAEFTATGRQLAQATLDTRALESRLSDIRVLERTSTSVRFRGTIQVYPTLWVEAWMFYDRNQPDRPSPSDFARRYGGDYDSWSVGLYPVISSLTPTPVARGQTITLLGSALDPGILSSVTVSGPIGASANSAGAPLVPALVVPVEDGGTRYASPVDHSDRALRYVVPEGAVSGPLELSYRSNGSGELERVELPVALDVLLPPRITRMLNRTTGQAVDVSAASPQSLRMHRDDRLRLEGSNLLTAGGGAPLVRMGSRQLRVLSTQARPPNHIEVSLPVGDELEEAVVTVETTAGAWASAPILLVPPPTLLGPVRMSESGLSASGGSGGFRSVEDGRLYRNRTFTIAGRNLKAGPADEGGGERTLWVAGIALGPDRHTISADGTSISFALYPDGLDVPADPLGSGPIAYEHAGGRSELGTFEIVEPPAALAEIELASDTVIGGEVLSGRVRFEAGTPPPDGDWIFMSAQPGGIVSVGPREPVVGGEVPLDLRTARVETEQQLVLRAEKAGVTREVAVRVLPRPLPRPVSLTFSSSSIVADNPVELTVELDRPGEGDLITLSSSDPALLDVPARVEATGDRVDVRARSLSVTERRTVEVTATSGGESVSGQLVLNPRPMRLTAVKLPSDRVTGPARIEGEIRVANQGATRPSVTVELEASPGVLVPRKVTVNGGRASFPIEVEGVAELRRASVRARSKVGEASVQFAVEPLRMAEVTLTPEVLKVGQSAKGVLRLAEPVTTDVRLRLQARTAGVVQVSETVTVSAGRTEGGFKIRGVGPGVVVVDVYPDRGKNPVGSLTVQVGKGSS